MKKLWHALLGLALIGCGSTAQPSAPVPAPAPSPAPAIDAGPAQAARPQGPWWTWPEPSCPGGAELAERTTTWGRLAWCAGGRVDDRLRLDLGRAAVCLHAAVSALQSEPELGALGAFLVTAEGTDLLPTECSMVERDRFDKRVITYREEEVELSRRVLGENLHGDGVSALTIQYRLSCTECPMFAETEIAVSIAGR